MTRDLIRRLRQLEAQRSTSKRTILTLAEFYARIARGNFDVFAGDPPLSHFYPSLKREEFSDGQTV